MKKGKEEARRILAEIHPRYDRHYLPTDPIQFPHLYKDPKDQELVALLSALLAFGNAKAVIQSVQKWLDPLGPSPSSELPRFLKQKNKFPSGHRWVRGEDIFALLTKLSSLYEQHETLEDLFLKGHSEDGNIRKGLEQFTEKLQIENSSQGFRYFIPSPTKGSPCKRLNLFLRWVVRPADGIDLGLWKRISPSQLIIPLDVHVFRFARNFRLSRTRTPNWKMAEEVTEFLRELDPQDPIKYDFAICHWGMEKNRR